MQPTPPSPPGSNVCRLCETPLTPGSGRCPACGLHQASDVPRDTRWQLVAGMAVVYAVVAALVLVTR